MKFVLRVVEKLIAENHSCISMEDRLIQSPDFVPLNVKTIFFKLLQFFLNEFFWMNFSCTFAFLSPRML